MSLRDASHCLTELAEGRNPERLFFVLTGALALDELRTQAAEGLVILSRSGKLELNDVQEMSLCCRLRIRSSVPTLQ
jgi:hypothetical protein